MVSFVKGRKVCKVLRIILNLVSCTLGGNTIKYEIEWDEKRLWEKKSVFDVWSSIIDINDCFNFDFFVVKITI